MVKRRRDAYEGDIVMNRKHILFALLTICVIMCNVCAVTAVAATLTQDDVIAASIFTENEELSRFGSVKNFL